jgi:hypothetical protein
MKTRLVKAFVSVFICASTALALGSDTAERKEIDAQIELLRKSRASYREIVEFLERRLDAGSVKTKAQLRVYIDRKILSFCSMPPWTQFSLWDKKWSDGKIPSLCEREIAAFNRGGPGAFILSLKAGGFGLNLTKATHVIHFDRWWNPAAESQATDRAHRIGQRKEVFVHLMITAGTLEEHVDDILRGKTRMADSLITESEWLEAVKLDE